VRWKHGAGILHRLQRSTYTFSETDSVSFESSGSVHSAPAWADGKPVQPPVYVLLRNIQLAPGRRRIWISADLTLVRADAESATNERNPRGWSGLTGHSQKRVGYRDGTHIQVDRSPTSNTTILGPDAWSASRREPGPSAFRFVTLMNRPSRPTGVSTPNPTAPGNTGVASEEISKAQKRSKPNKRTVVACLPSLEFSLLVPVGRASF